MTPTASFPHYTAVELALDRMLHAFAVLLAVGGIVWLFVTTLPGAGGILYLLQGDDITETLQSAFEVCSGACLIDLVEINLTQLAVADAAGQIGGDVPLRCMIMENPKLKAWLWHVVSFVVIALVLFLSAGTLSYWQMWAYLFVGGIASIPLTLYAIRDPILLENRTKAGPSAEQRPIQKLIVLCMGLPAIVAFIVPGLDHRFSWSNMSPWLSLTGNLLILLSMWMVYRVFKENSFASATVEISNGQKVISTGPYAIVRHPMYSSAAVYLIGMSLALGSYWGLIPSILTIFGLVVRLFDEEKFLVKNLPGYTEYCAKVRSHLIPGIF